MASIAISPNVEIPAENVKLSSLQEKLNAALVTATEYIEVPPICFEIMDNDLSSEIGTLGNISLFIGKAKQGKTFAISMALAAADKGDWLMNKIRIQLPQNKRTVLFFDTEQSKFHVQRVVRRIAKLGGNFEPENLMAYGLRGYSAIECLELVEYALYNTPEIGFVVIDGVRDLVTSINDEEQSSMISSKLLKWSQDLNIHIVTVLHMNKSDTNARGHLGTELTNKSESVISIAKDTDPAFKDRIIISPEYCRNREFLPFAFKIDNEGMPYIVDIDILIGSQAKKSLMPIDIPPETHCLVLDAVFRLSPQLKYSELILQIKDHFMRYGIKFGENKAKDFATFYQNDGYIEAKKPASGATMYSNLHRKFTKIVSIKKELEPRENDEEPPF